jgi:hypothetical protein
MDFAMEDKPSSAPGGVPAAKLSASRKGPDAQSVTKRYVELPCYNQSCYTRDKVLTFVPLQIANRAHAAHDLACPRGLCVSLC